MNATTCPSGAPGRPRRRATRSAAAPCWSSRPTSRRGARSSTARPGSPRCRPGSSPARSAADRPVALHAGAGGPPGPGERQALHAPVRPVRAAGQGDRRSPLHGGAVDDRVRGRARPVGGDLHLRDLRPRRGGRPGRRRDGPASLRGPGVRDEFSVEDLAIDARDFHVYAAEWLPGYVAFFVDHQLVKLVEQSPGYPMQFMLDIYEFPEDQPPQPADAYPKQFVVDYFRGYRSPGEQRVNGIKVGCPPAESARTSSTEPQHRGSGTCRRRSSMRRTGAARQAGRPAPPGQQRLSGRPGRRLPGRMARAPAVGARLASTDLEDDRITSKRART